MFSVFVMYNICPVINSLYPLLLSARHCAVSSARTQKSPQKMRSSGENSEIFILQFLNVPYLCLIIRSCKGYSTERVFQGSDHLVLFLMGQKHSGIAINVWSSLSLYVITRGCKAEWFIHILCLMCKRKNEETTERGLWDNGVIKVENMCLSSLHIKFLCSSWDKMFFCIDFL